MKLFKKVAAVALAAVLALSMVGCGVGGNGLTGQVMDYIEDVAHVSGRQINHDEELDKATENLIAEAGKAYKKGEKEDVRQLLTDKDVVKAAQIDTAKGVYYVSFTKNSDFKSSLVSEHKTEVLAQNLVQTRYAINATTYPTEKQDVGIAMGKIGDDEYIVMLWKNVE